MADLERAREAVGTETDRLRQRLEEIETGMMALSGTADGRVGLNPWLASAAVSVRNAEGRLGLLQSLLREALAEVDRLKAEKEAN